MSEESFLKGFFETAGFHIATRGLNVPFYTNYTKTSKKDN